MQRNHIQGKIPNELWMWSLEYFAPFSIWHL